MASCSSDVTGRHQQAKDLIYTAHKCTLCKQRCLFRTRKMVKCIACKCVMHKRCYLAANHRRAPSADASDGNALAIVHRSPRPPPVTAVDDDAESRAAGDRGTGPVLITDYTLVRVNGNGTLAVTMKVELRLGGEQHVVMGFMEQVAKEMWYELSGGTELRPAKDA